MRRRSVLASAGVLLFAGCTGGPSGPNNEPTTQPPPSVVDSAFEVGDAGCGSQSDESASVSFVDGVVRVTGSVIGANGCYRARLGDVSYDAERDTCRVVVEAFDASEEDELCVQCVTAIDYEASVTFEGGLPGTVEVVHDDMGGKSVVATASP